MSTKAEGLVRRIKGVQRNISTEIELYSKAQTRAERVIAADLVRLGWDYLAQLERDLKGLEVGRDEALKALRG